MSGKRKQKPEIPVETLRRMGYYVPQSKPSPWRHLVNWWETTYVEKVLESLVADLQKLAFLDLINFVGSAAIIVATITYVWNEKHRRDAEVYNAWQTLTNAYGQPGNGGRIRALEFLNASPGAPWRWRILFLPRRCTIRQQYFIDTPRIAFLCFTWPPESLGGIDLSSDREEDDEVTERVYLRSINLQDAYLQDANLQYADFWEGNLEGADLRGANLKGANLRAVNLKGANLKGANLEGANLGWANLEGADLDGVYLRSADLGGAILLRTNLSSVNIETSRGVPYLCATKLSMHYQIDLDRDCDKLPEILLKRSQYTRQLDERQFKTIDEARKYVNDARQEAR